MVMIVMMYETSSFSLVRYAMLFCFLKGGGGDNFVAFLCLFFANCFDQNDINFEAAVIELPIDKGDWRLIFKFLHKFTQGILSHG